MNAPLISIITVTFNTDKYLEDTINSVANQTYENIEHIIVDGGSTDQTLHIIKKHQVHLSTWISEPDEGISDAMNKGVRIARGDYILFLHSDDYLISPDILSKAVSYMQDNVDIYTFKVQLDDGIQQRLSDNSEFGFLTNFKMGSCHQGQLCSRRLFDTIGGFDTDLKITMDYDLMLRAYRQGFKAKSVDKTLSVMRLIGISSKQDWKSLAKRFNEEQRVHKKNRSQWWHPLLYTLYWSPYIIYRRLKSILKI